MRIKRISGNNVTYVILLIYKTNDSYNIGIINNIVDDTISCRNCQMYNIDDENNIVTCAILYTWNSAGIIDKATILHEIAKCT